MLEQQNTKQHEQNMRMLSLRSDSESEDSISQLLIEFQELKQSLIEWMKQKESPSIGLEDTLWTVEDVAKYLHKSKGTIQSHYQNKHGFPRSKKIGSARYWRPQEIIAYAKRP